MLETDTEKNSSYGSKPALPRAGEQKKRACEEFQYDFSNGTKRSEARPEETYFYGENQPMMFEESVKAKNGGGSKNAEKGLAVFLTVAAVVFDVVINMAWPILKKKRWLPIAVMLAAFLATRFFSVNIILIILVCGVIGALDTLYLQKREDDK